MKQFCLSSADVEHEKTTVADLKLVRGEIESLLETPDGLLKVKSRIALAER